MAETSPPGPGGGTDSPVPAEHTEAPEARRLFGSFLALGSGEMLARLIAFGATVYLARILGTAGFGIIGFATAIAGYFSLAFQSGFHGVGMREVARRPEEAAAMAVSVAVFRLGLAVVSLTVLAVIAAVLDKPPVVKLVLLLSGLSFFSLAVEPSWVLKGLERNRWVGAGLILTQAVFTVGVLLLVRSPADVVLVPVVQFAGELVMALLMMGVVLRLGRVRLHVVEGWRIFRSSGSLTVVKVLRTLIFTFDILLLGLLIGESEVGVYTAAYRLCFFVLALAAALSASYLPSFTRAREEAAAAVGRLGTRLLDLTSWLGAPLVVGGAVLARPLLGTIFGAEYEVGAWALRLLLVSIGLVYLYGAVHNAFLVYHRTRTEVLIVAAAAAFNVGLNFALIPRYGIEGAAAATALTEVLSLGAGLAVLARLGVRFSFFQPLKYAAAAGAMGLVLLAVGLDHDLYVSVPLGVFVYGGLTLAVGWVPDDVRPHLRHLPFSTGAGKP